MTSNNDSPGKESRSAEQFAPFAFAATIFLSAFLLFQVQPLISKFILPWFGGSPAVWTAAMLFFQFVLFGGYLYAHLTSSFLGARGQFYLHLLILAGAAALTWATQIVPAEAWKPTGASNESPLFAVLFLLGATVGIPYFTVSSTGPLLQKWFGDSFPGASPYRLFALSNFGSLAALLSYPFFFEVCWDSHQQAGLWTIGFLLFAACCAYCAWFTFRSRRTDAAQSAGASSAGTASDSDPAPSWLVRFAWIALPALASVMLLAVTNEVCQNVATVPLLWIIPLSLYLISFIVAFDHPRWYWRLFYTVAGTLAVAYVACYDNVNDLLGLDLGWMWECGAFFTAFFYICMICHCELAEIRPSRKWLTSYYMTLSLGGAVGGTLVNLLAPYLFDTFFELKLGLIASLLIAALLVPKERFAARGFAGVIAICACLAILSGIVEDFNDLTISSRGTKHRSLHRARNFYGMVEVQHRSFDNPADANHTFFSGHIQHGRQWSDPERRSIPLTYYGEGSGVQKAMELVQKKPSVRIGVVGLGIGTLAAYARENDVIRFYEINPEVVKIAENKEWFHYLGDCKGKYEIVLGDARAQLEREFAAGGSQKYDLLVLDAFSGDAIPTHLMTDEAFELYKHHLSDDGILAFHITNTYLDLYPVVKMLAEKHQLAHSRVYFAADDAADQKLLHRSYYLLASRNESIRTDIPEEISTMPEEFRVERKIRLWTDRYNNLLQILQY